MRSTVNYEAIQVVDSNGFVHTFDKSEGYNWQYSLVEGTIDVLDKTIVQIIRDDGDYIEVVTTFLNPASVGADVRTFPEPSKTCIAECPKCGFVQHSLAYIKGGE